MGGGKSRIAGEHLARTRPARVVVLAPAKVLSTWGRELRTWAPGYKAEMLGRLPVVERIDLLRAHARDDGHVAVLNYDVVWRPELLKALKAFRPDVLVLDESHRIKAPIGRTSKAVYTLAAKVPGVVELTGRPMPHSPLDLFAQARVLDDRVFGPSWRNFRSRYAVLGGPHEEWVTHLRIQRTVRDRNGFVVPNLDYSPELAAEFAAALGLLAVIVSDDEVDAALRAAAVAKPGLLPAGYRTHPLPGAARRAYLELEEDLVALVEAGEITASNVLVKLLRLAQLASGLLMTDDGAMGIAHDERREALADLLEDVPASDRVVVFCRFRHELEAVAEVAERAGRVHAELSGRRTDALDADGRLAPGVELAGVQLQSGKEGVDLSRANGVVFYGHTYSLGDYDQCIARCDRPGQIKPVWITHLVAEGTVDETVYEALTERREVVEDVLARLS